MSIEDKLKMHKENICKLQLALLELDNLERELIEELCLPACVITDMPRSVTNKFHSATENAVIAKDLLKHHHIDEIMRQSKEICRVETVLKTLSRLDKALVELRYFEKCTWGMTAKLYAEKADIPYISKDALKKANKRMLYKLETLLGGE
jgi:hypothetical protein